MRLESINDRHLQAHLAGKMSLGELRLHWQDGVCPWRIDGDQVVVDQAVAERARVPVPSVATPGPAHPWCRHGVGTGADPDGCVPCKGHLVDCSHPARAAVRRAYSALCRPGTCRWHEPARISVVIVARDEDPDDVDATVESVLAGGADQVIVVDDASRTPVRLRSTDQRVRVINHPEPRGPAAGRNEGAAAATGEVVVWMDAHMRVPEGGLVRLARTACERGAIACAAISPLDGEGDAWIRYGGRMVLDPATLFRIEYNTSPPARGEVTALIGACYAAHTSTIARVGGWPLTQSWGYNEQALSLAAHVAGVPLVVEPAVVAQHRFRKQFPYEIRKSSAMLNRWIVHWLLSEDETWRNVWYTRLMDVDRGNRDRADEAFRSRGTDRQRYQRLRQRSDAEVWQLLGVQIEAPGQRIEVRPPPLRERGIAVAVSTYPAYERWVEGAIRSVDAQEHLPAETWLLCDRCEPPAGLGPDWRVIRGDWGSPSPGRNEVLRQTQCDWVIWLDADDELPQSYHATMASAAGTADPHVAVLYPTLVYCDAEMQRQTDRRFPEYSYWGLREANCCPTPSCWRVDALREAGGWPQVMGQDDWCAAFSVTRLGWTAQSIPAAHVLVRRHDRSRGRANEHTEARQWASWHGRTYEVVMLLGGRADMLPVQREWMESAELPPHLAVTIRDNSRDAAFRASVLDWTRWLADSGCPVRYLRDDSGIRVSGRDGRNWHVCDLYNRVLPAVQADYVVTWEHDVVPPRDALLRLVQAVTPGTRMGIMAAAYRCRGGSGGLLTATRDLSRGFPHVRRGECAGQPFKVQATGGGFTLIDNAALRQCLPCRYTFRRNGTAIGWDGNLGLNMARIGWSVWLHGGVECEHRFQ